MILSSQLAFASCPEPGAVRYPVSDVLQSAGISLQYDFSRSRSNHDYGSEAHVAEVRDTVLEALAGKSQAERDALLLGRLSFTTIGTIPLINVTTSVESGLFETYLDMLDRTELVEHAAALRGVRDAFPEWGTTAQERYYQWSDGKGRILNPELDAALKAQSERFVNAEPSLLDRADEILRDDPAYAMYAEQRENMDAYQRYTYLMKQIGSCIARYETPEEADAALAAAPPLLADFHVIDLFLLESGNGGMHQYLFNSTGMLAPQLAEVFARWGLTEEAQAMEETLALFPSPFPRDRSARRAVFGGFTEAQHEAANAATWISDAPAIWEAVETRAKEAGYWPL